MSISQKQALKELMDLTGEMDLYYKEFNMVTERPWGYFVVLEDRSSHKLKRIVVYPGGKLSYQMHRKRDEYWTITKGQGLFTLDGISQYVGPGSTLQIPAGRKHRISNESDSELEFIEVQLGEYFGEDDIQRFEDAYGRTDK